MPRVWGATTVGLTTAILTERCFFAVAFKMCEVLVREPLGSGSYGKVYRATWRGKDYALKVSSDRMCEEIAISIPEYDIYTRLDHPYLLHSAGLGVVTAADLKGCADLRDIKQAVMLPLAKMSLEDLRTGKTTSAYAMVAGAWQLACGLSALHASGYIHADIKPGNMLMMDGKWVHSDFGISFLKRIPTLRHSIYTASYRAPEIRVGLSTASVLPAEVYALGMSYLDLSTHPDGPFRPPYDAMNEQTYVEVTHQKAEAIALKYSVTPPTTSMERRGLQGLPSSSVKAWFALLASMLRKDPTRRPTLDTVLDTLEVLWPQHPARPVLRTHAPAPGLAPGASTPESKLLEKMLSPVTSIDKTQVLAHALSLTSEVLGQTLPVSLPKSVYAVACLYLVGDFYQITRRDLEQGLVRAYPKTVRMVRWNDICTAMDAIMTMYEELD